MEENSVVLNVYELPMSTSGIDQLRQYASVTSFFSKILPSVGLGAFHTSVDVDGFCYSYAVGGISKIPVANKHKYIPSHATFKESIVLGSMTTTTTNNSSPFTSSTIHKCIENLKTEFFTSIGYHLTYRNCNHFTETFATALIVPMEELLKKNPVLKSYPTWINRLARTVSTGLDKNADKTANENNNISSSCCVVIKEARMAVGILDYDDDKKLAALSASVTDSNKQTKKKKELTQKQKNILAKLKSPR